MAKGHKQKRPHRVCQSGDTKHFLNGLWRSGCVRLKLSLSVYSRSGLEKSPSFVLIRLLCARNFQYAQSDPMGDGCCLGLLAPFPLEKSLLAII